MTEKNKSKNTDITLHLNALYRDARKLRQVAGDKSIGVLGASLEDPESDAAEGWRTVEKNTFEPRDLVDIPREV